MSEQVHAPSKSLSLQLQSSDGPESAILVLTYASLVPQDDILGQLCLKAIEELLLCHGETFVSQISHPLECHRYNKSFIFLSLAPLLQTLLQKMCPCQQGNKLSANHLYRPCIQHQTEVEVQRHQFSTVHDVESLVRGIERTLCTMVDSTNASNCVVNQCQDLCEFQDEMV